MIDGRGHGDGKGEAGSGFIYGMPGQSNFFGDGADYGAGSGHGDGYTYGNGEGNGRGEGRGVLT